MTSLQARGLSFSSEVEFADNTYSNSSKTWLQRLKKFLWSDWEEQGIQLQQPGELALTEPDEMQSGFTRYDDFNTIDWIKDLSKDRRRHRYLELHRTDTLRKKLGFLWDSCAGWICVSIVGMLCGCAAAFIDIGTSWMVDLKEGFCENAFWLNREQCCWLSNTTSFEDENCDQWLMWAELFGASEDETSLFYGLRYASYVVMAVFMASLAGLFVRTFAPYAGGGGIPELKTVLSGFIIRGLLGKWTLVIKLFGVMLAVASGLVLGKEGPLVHIACCIGNIVSRFFPKYGKNEAKKREILSAAAAAGVSVAFGAPIGGVLFSLEEVSYYFPPKTLWRTFFCALVASFILSTINPFGNDHMIVFYVEYNSPWIFVEIVPFILLGALGGIFATVFIKANVFWCKLRKNSKLGNYPIIEIITVTFITAVLSFPNPFTRMDTVKLIALLVRDCSTGHTTPLCDYIYDNTTSRFGLYKAGAGIGHTLFLLTMTLIFKFFLMIITVGMKIPAGLYIPSLAIGAIIGRIVGIGAEQLVYYFPVLIGNACGANCITPGLYGMVGAAAFLGGVTRMTVGLVVIMFEVTGGVRYIVPLMLAVMTSKWVGDGLCKAGIFEALIELNNYPFLDIKEEFGKRTFASDVRKPRDGEIFTLLTQHGMTVGQVERILMESTYNGFPIVESIGNKHLVGFVLRRDLLLALAHAKRTKSDVDENTSISFIDLPNENQHNTLKMNKIVNMATITVTDVTPLETIIDIFKKLGLRHLLVVDKGILLGVITKKDLLHHLKDD